MGPMSDVIKSVRQFSRRKTPPPRNDRLGSTFERQYLVGAGLFWAGRTVPADTGVRPRCDLCKESRRAIPTSRNFPLPLAVSMRQIDCPVRVPHQNDPSTAAPARTARILVVEDEVLTRAFIAEELRLAGFRVIEADRADDGLTYIKAAVEQVDLVFSDIQTPGSLDGLQLAEILRDKYPDIPVILTSGNAPPRHVGIVEAFVPKPYDVTQTIALMSSILAQKSPGEPL